MDSCWKQCCTTLSQRWIFAVMSSLAVLNVYTMRICLSLAITKMVAQKNTGFENATKSDETCPASETISPSLNSGATLQWDEYTQGIILSSYFWGYIVTQLPGGILATKFGGKHIAGLGIFSTSVFTLLTPIVIQAYDYTGLVVLRTVIGLCEGATLPAVVVLISKWAPPHERSKITTVVMTGAQVGSVLATAMSGVLIQHSSIGWPIVFYVFGAFGILWFLCWVVLCYNSPDVHPFISVAERDYLHERMKKHTHNRKQPTPWRHILTSVPVWALLAGKIGREWGLQMMVSDLPKYMSSILKFSIQANGFVTALPNLAMWVVSIGTSWFADWLIKSGKISNTDVRKIFVTTSSVGPAIFIIAASYAGCNHTVAVVLFTASMGMMGPCYSGISSNMLDLSPNHSGVVTGIVTTVGSLCGMLVPYTVGIMTPNQTIQEWRVVFWITFAIFFVSALIYDFWADGEVQYWNDLDLKGDKEQELSYKEDSQFIEKPTEPSET